MQLNAVKSYIINLLFSYNSFNSFIHYFSLFILFSLFFYHFHYNFAVKVVHICLWHCFEQWNLLFIHIHHTIFLVVLFHSFGVHRLFGLWFCIWNAAHKIFGGYVSSGNLRVMFGWYLGHPESPITPVTRLILMWNNHICIYSKSNI